MGDEEDLVACCLCGDELPEDEMHRDEDLDDWICYNCYSPGLYDDPDYLCELAWDRAHGLY